MIRVRNCRVRASRRLREDLRRRALLEDPALVEEADPVRDVAREAHLVGRDEHRHAAGGELADDVEHLRDELRVERGGDLVEQQQVRLHRERPHDRHPLLLAARQPVRHVARLRAEAEPLEQRQRLPLRLGARPAQHLARRERHVVEHRHVREQVERLEHDPDPAPDPVDVDALGGDLLALDEDPPGVDRLDAG